jgi:hypothetical protein
VKTKNIELVINELKSDMKSKLNGQPQLKTEVDPTLVNTGRVHLEGKAKAWMLIPKEVAQKNDKDLKTWKEVKKIEDNLMRAKSILHSIK